MYKWNGKSHEFRRKMVYGAEFDIFPYRSQKVKTGKNENEIDQRLINPACKSPRDRERSPEIDRQVNEDGEKRAFFREKCFRAKMIIAL